MNTKLKHLRREKRWKLYIFSLLGLLALLFCVILLLAKLASYGAASVFNYAVSRQDMLRGTLTVESVTANIHGGVTFENLSWDDPEGHPILRVPSGTLKVNPWDIIGKRLVSTTLQEITLYNPVFAVRFDEEMKVDFVNRKEEEQKSRDTHETLEEKVSNFNRNGKPLKLDVTIHNGQMEAFYENRRYLLSHVNMTGHVDTKGITRLSLTTGSFGGTAVGEGAEFSAEINFKEKELPSTISFTAKGVDPSSLGLGDDIHDKMTLTALGSGPFAHPEARGTLTMEELHIPSLDFYDLKGDIHYQEGFLTFTDVKARVYGGTVTASGDYHMDSRAYNIYLHGERLDSRIPSNDPKFYCLVTLDGEIHCPGDSKSLTAFGRFSSGPGFYALIPFESITGTFNNRYRAVDFYDVSIDTRFGTFRTDAFHIWNGKLHLGAIEFIDKNTGEAINLHDIQNREGPEKTVEKIRKNVKSIKQQVHELSVK